MRFESSRRLTDCIRDIRMSRYTFYTHTNRHTQTHTPRHGDIHRKKSSAVQKEAIVSTDRLVKLFILFGGFEYTAIVFRKNAQNGTTD